MRPRCSDRDTTIGSRRGRSSHVGLTRFGTMPVDGAAPTSISAGLPGSPSGHPSGSVQALCWASAIPRSGEWETCVSHSRTPTQVDRIARYTVRKNLAAVGYTRTRPASSASIRRHMAAYTSTSPSIAPTCAASGLSTTLSRQMLPPSSCGTRVATRHSCGLLPANRCTETTQHLPGKQVAVAVARRPVGPHAGEVRTGLPVEKLPGERVGEGSQIALPGQHRGLLPCVVPSPAEACLAAPGRATWRRTLGWSATRRRSSPACRPR